MAVGVFAVSCIPSRQKIWLHMDGLATAMGEAVLTLACFGYFDMVNIPSLPRHKHPRPPPKQPGETLHPGHPRVGIM